jgi:Ca2+-binding RTX toxin-like protein
MALFGCACPICAGSNADNIASSASDIRSNCSDGGSSSYGSRGDGESIASSQLYTLDASAQPQALSAPASTYVDTIIANDISARWNVGAAVGTSTFVTYSFMTSVPSYDSASSRPGFQAFNATQQQSAREALYAWASVSGLQFIEVAAGSGSIRFGEHNFNGTANSTAAGYAYYPSLNVFNGSTSAFGLGGDVWVNAANYANDPLNAGFGKQILLHEIGHALGLKHSFEAPSVLPADIDNTNTTVMSYNWKDTSTLGWLDIEAARYLYGYSDVYSYWSGSYLLTSGGEDDNAVYGLEFADLMLGNGGADRLYGALGDDTVLGGNGDDVISGDAGNDLLVGDDFAYQSGNDVIYGGAGVDTIVGGYGNDVIYGEAGNDVILGGAGNDYILASDASNSYAFTSEILLGETGSDTIIGGAGNDLITGGYFDATDVDGDYLYGAEGNDFIFGEGGNDTLVGGTGQDTIYGGNGNDYVDGSSGNDVILGEAGNDTLVSGGDYDSLYGGTGDDLLYATGFGYSLLSGEDGNDILYGGASSDSVYGGAGDDFLNGGLGADRLYGGTGYDLFVLNSLGTSADSIIDFTTAEDTFGISIAGFGITSQADLITNRLVLNGAAQSATLGQFLVTSSSIIWDSNGTGAGGQTTLAFLSGTVGTISITDFYAI